ncbi:MAG: RecX family transcriptional regulator [Bacilli bacterium]|nr:RecX family transcriptional regulator [Bacilli bacterium]
MTIKKFTKGRNGMYILNIDEKKYRLHEDLILEYKLIINKEISNEVLYELIEKNKKYEIYEVALKYISIKMRSKKEISEYLKKKEYSNIDIEEVTSILENNGYLNNNHYIEAFIHDKINLSSYGPEKIKQELKQNGFSEDNILEKIKVYSDELQYERIDKIINKMIKINKNKSGVILKRKIEMYLLNLGYEKEKIISSLEKFNYNDEDLYKKEYEKQLKKLSKKYKDKELEYKIKQKMYQNGFYDK